MRLDVVVTERFFLTRNKSQAFIKDGLVSVDGTIVKKPAFEVSGSEMIELQEEKKIHWVSRSAGKLDGFLQELRITNYELRVIGTNCLDVGSSTGGFTQVLLERSASHVDAVDVGTDQLHPSLRNNQKVTSYEQTDIRNFTSKKSYDIIVCDASFISLKEILPSILDFANASTEIILLWKPQFEVGKEHLRKTGVPKDHKRILEKQREWEGFLEIHNCKVLQKKISSVIGEAGNEEWLYWIHCEKIIGHSLHISYIHTPQNQYKRTAMNLWQQFRNLLSDISWKMANKKLKRAQMRHLRRHYPDDFTESLQS